MQRDIHVREQMFSMIREWQQRGLSQKDFCKRHAVGYHVFHYWYKCFNRAQPAVKENGFMPLKIEQSSAINTACAAVELLLADGRRLIFHQAVSSDYLKVLIS